MMITESDNVLAIAIHYLKTLEADAPAKELLTSYSEAVGQIHRSPNSAGCKSKPERASLNLHLQEHL